MLSSRAKKSTNGRSGLRALRLGVGLAGALSPELAARLAEQAFLTPRRRPPRRSPDMWDVGVPLAIPSGDQLLVGKAWGNGPIVLLVHGWEGHSGQLEPFVAPLVRRGCRVIAFDAPAHGDSPGRQLSLVDQARAVIAAAAAAGRTPTGAAPAGGTPTGAAAVHGIVAHSFGAAAATVALSFGLRAERVAYVAPVFGIERAVRGFAAAVGLDEDEEAAFRKRLEVRNHGHSAAELDGPALAPRMRPPLLVVHDRQDREIPISEGEALRAVWPGASLIETEGLGHHRILRDAGVQRTVADFLGVSPAAGGRTLMESIEHELFNRDAR